jgi:DNA-binding CsgD family transcriptional regulator
MTVDVVAGEPGSPATCAGCNKAAVSQQRTPEGVRPGAPPRSARPPALMGREEERRRVERYVDTMTAGAPPLVIVGEPGIGKSTVWQHGVACARAAGHRVLVSRPTEDECREPAAGLADLFDGTRDGSGDSSMHLRAAVAADTEPVERGRHTLHVLRGLARGGPVLLAVDDLQWLDAVSAKALRFALARLGEEPVGLVATARLPTDGSVLPPSMVGDVELLEVGAMDVPTLRRVLAAVVSAITAPELTRAHRLSQGNPMLAIELVRSWQRGGRGAAQVAPLRALAQRVEQLAPDAAAVARVLALAGPQPAAVIEQVSDVADFPGAVRAGVDAGILQVEDDFTVRYTHALYASAVVGSITALDGAAIHARLAETVSDPDVAARHLAYATAGPDEPVAACVDAAAVRWARRGAFDVAADLTAHSVRLTPPELDEMAAERALREVSYRAASGDAARALQSAKHLASTLRPGRRRAEALSLRVFLHSVDSERFLREALDHAGDDVVLRAHVLDLLGWQLGYYQGRLNDGIAYCTAALEVARGVPNTDQVVMCAEATLSICSALLGSPRDDLIEHALALDEANPPAPLGRWAPIFHGRQLLWAGHLHKARQVFEQMRRRAVTVGSEFQRPYRHYELALVEIAAGDLDAAVRHADEAIEAARDAGNEQAIAWAASALGLVAAHQGDVEGVQRAVELITDWQASADHTPRLITVDEILGTLASTRGDWVAALAHFENAVAVFDALGFAHPGARPALPRAVEAAAMVGDESRCAALTDRLAEQAKPLAVPWVDAQVAYARGLLALLRGQSADATEQLRHAAASLDHAGYRLDAGRVWLNLSRAWLRAGQRSQAREAAAQARDAFAGAPVTPWVTAADELAQRAGACHAGAGLTATETEIAALIAAGRTNREIASHLFLAVSTIEAHLTRIYRKLGLRGRTQLTGWVHAAA